MASAFAFQVAQPEHAFAMDDILTGIDQISSASTTILADAAAAVGLGAYAPGEILKALTADKMNFIKHGGMMWGSWSALALVQVGSNRYFKGNTWKYNQWIHSITGTGMILLSLYAA